MSPEDRIFEILVGQKVYTDGKWHVYDAYGAELSDPGGIMWRSSPGALLMWPKDEGLPAWDTSQGMAGKFKRAQYNRILRDDELVTDLIVSLVTQGFFDGHTQNMFGGR